MTDLSDNMRSLERAAQSSAANLQARRATRMASAGRPDCYQDQCGTKQKRSKAVVVPLIIAIAGGTLLANFFMG